jgi:hypothetical protein
VSIIDTYQFIDVVDNPTASTWTGFGYGFGEAAQIPANPTKPLVLMYARWDNLTYNLLLAKGDSTAYETKVLTGVSAPNINRKDHLRIVYWPGAYVEGFVNGVSGGRITTASKFPAPGFTGKYSGFTTFWQGGTNPLSQMSTAWWYSRYRVEMP